MSNTFKAVVADKQDDEKQTVSIRELEVSELPDYDVEVDVEFSTLNYKDGLAVTGSAPICRSFPMVCGIDLAGTVTSTDAEGFAAGDRVLVNGYGLSESEWGGYSQKARLKSEWLVKVPETFSNRDAMAIGTAGYTAMLCVQALEQNGVEPGRRPRDRHRRCRRCRLGSRGPARRSRFRGDGVNGSRRDPRLSECPRRHCVRGPQ